MPKADKMSRAGPSIATAGGQCPNAPTGGGITPYWSRPSALQTSHQFRPDLLQPAVVSFFFLVQDSGDLSGGFHARFRVLLDLEVDHLLDQPD
jgi:hypothetical protein